MPQSIPDAFLDLFKKKSIAYLGTLMADGTPQVTPVWVDFDGEHILINTAVGRLKDVNMTKRPKIGLTIQDPENAYRYISIQGQVVGVVEDAEGARDHINKLARRYDGKDFTFPPGQKRRIYKINTEKILTGD
jgi:PPOX class probable F420-dependent enzyme